MSVVKVITAMVIAARVITDTMVIAGGMVADMTIAARVIIVARCDSCGGDCY